MKWEPVRTWIYGLLLPVQALVVWYGIATDQEAALWAAVITAAIGVVGTEVARSKVTPVGKITGRTAYSSDPKSDAAWHDGTE